MTNLMLLAFMQLVVSTKAGLVNDVRGTANVAQMEMAQPGAPITTGPASYAEILLTPGSFLRLSENGEAVLESVELANVAVRIVKGPAVVEVIEIDKKSPIRVTTGNLTVAIVANGIYRFENGVAAVLEGKLETADSKFAYKKGWEVFYKDAYRARKTGLRAPASLDVYSARRSAEIARINYELAWQANPASWTYADAWAFAPSFGFFTYIPRSNQRSPYGYAYYRMGGVSHSGFSYYGSRSNPAADASNSGGYSAPSNSGAATSSNAAGDSGAGAAAAPTFATPTGGRAPAVDYIGSKNAPVPATAP